MFIFYVVLMFSVMSFYLGTHFHTHIFTTLVATYGVMFWACTTVPSYFIVVVFNS